MVLALLTRSPPSRPHDPPTNPRHAFDITAPNVGGFIVSIADEGALEFLLVLERG